MGIKKTLWSGVLALALSVALPPAFADAIIGSGGASFQGWAATNLNENGSPYWDNASMDGPGRNVGSYLINAPTAPLSGAPGALPYWGNAFTSNPESGGTADMDLFFLRTAASSTAILKLEVSERSNVNEFGWYNVTDPATLHPLFLGPDVAVTTSSFSPSAQYGFYVRSATTNLYFMQSSLNPDGDTEHQHFAIFQESPVPGAESYWIGVEAFSVNELGGNEGNEGDYNDMLIHLSVVAVPEPSTFALAGLGAVALLGGCRMRRRSS